MSIPMMQSPQQPEVQGNLPRPAPIPRRKLGILLSTKPDHSNFRHGIRLAGAALVRGVDVYLYCIDDAVCGVDDPELQALRARGLKLYACAYGAQRRNLPVTDHAAFAGLTIVSDMIGGTDRFVSFGY